MYLIANEMRSRVKDGAVIRKMFRQSVGGHVGEHGLHELVVGVLVVEDLSDDRVRILSLVVHAQVGDVLEHQRQQLIVAQDDMVLE
jgi:hypothetical protein